MKIIDPKQSSSYKVLEALIEKISPAWENIADFIKIVPALKTKNGIVQPETLVLGFCVKEKLSEDQLKSRNLPVIPKEIEGVATDVIATHNRPHDGTVNTRDTRSQMFDTLAGGMAVGNADMGVYGTLAMIVFSQDDDRPLGLTNEHVLVFDVDGQVGDEVQQPRFFLNSEVSIDPADCCPNGQLHYRGVDNPIVDVAAAVFAAAALAAALSDDIDPHRRGQDATKPDDDERTIKETVKVDMNYPEIPFPGRPYKVKVKWDYDRQTDRRVLSHSVGETKKNQHYIDVQELITDKLVYQRGNTVTFYALLGTEKERKNCGNYFVTAAALSPSNAKAYKIILKPFQTKENAKIGHPILKINESKSIRYCVSFEHEKPVLKFTHQKNIDGMLFDPGGFPAYIIRQTENELNLLQFPDNGIMIRFRFPVREVFVKGYYKSEKGVTFKAFNNAFEVGSITSRKSPDTLHISADAITHVIISGGNNEGLIQEICVVKAVGEFCLYRGQLTLAPGEELGMWNTYLFAQTRNDVPLNTDSLIAAQTIGGLPVTNNFSEGGVFDNFLYGISCSININPNGKFQVIAPAPEIEK